jgi:ACR3 family arsenite efflux pump ArsB
LLAFLTEECCCQLRPEICGYESACIVAGIALGHLLPAPFQAVGQLEVAQVNLRGAVLIWLD